MKELLNKLIERWKSFNQTKKIVVGIISGVVVLGIAGTAVGALTSNVEGVASSDINSSSNYISSTTSSYDISSEVSSTDSNKVSSEASSKETVQSKVESKVESKVHIASSAPAVQNTITVYTAGKNGSVYHKSSECSNMKTPYKTTLQDAKNRNLKKCPKCWADGEGD